MASRYVATIDSALSGLAEELGFELYCLDRKCLAIPPDDRALRRLKREGYSGVKVAEADVGEVVEAFHVLVDEIKKLESEVGKKAVLTELAVNDVLWISCLEEFALSKADVEIRTDDACESQVQIIIHVGGTRLDAIVEFE